MGKRSKKKAAKIRMAKWITTHMVHSSKQPKLPPQFRDSTGRLMGANEVVFPIVQQIGEREYKPVGTGFLIHPLGGFVTAKHCLTDENGNPTENNLAIHTLYGTQYIRKIVYFECHPIADIGVGMLGGSFKDALSHQVAVTTSFPLAKDPIQLGDAIMTIGYPRMKIYRGVNGVFKVDRFDGVVIDERTSGTARLQSSTFFTDMHIPSGASGGPVIRNSKIIGVNSSSFESAPDEPPTSCITPISAIYDLVLRESSGNTTTIQHLMDDGTIPAPL